ncbi:zinc transporter ZntB [Sulfitobacter sp. F26204]|uniref:CorA family divalent cation transporter n=1 Tax=Sulfitobacter sp. F26204 TaxID=2996014 RepID=UPI00225E48CF|nr:CorA family divalent cation transporter [Sulfitobacter sp. F26204]MCX7558481.1 zinc transporter ZntB [Sulfitobacter sp. F26204]
MTLSVFDISEDGSATIPSGTHLTGSTGYRWWHFDLSDPNLPAWCAKHLAPIPAGALLQPETRPRCDSYEDGLLLNLRGINLNEGQPAEQMVSIRMWVAEDVVITVRLRRVFAIDDIKQEILAQMAPPTPAAFVTALVTRLTLRVQEEVMTISKLTEFFEADLDDDTTPIPRELPLTRRRVIRLRRYLEPQRAALVKLANSDLPLIPGPDRLLLREQANRTTITVEELDAQRERLITVQDDHDLDVARKQARHAHVLSVAAGVFLPLSFLTGLFGVNIAGMTGLQNPLAFSLLCLGIVGLAVVIVVVMRLIRWL